VEPDLFEAYGLILRADLPHGTVSSPAGSGEEPLQRVVPSVHPETGTAKAIGPQRVRTGVQQPRAVASMLRSRIHNKLVDRTVHTRVDIVILARHCAGESHDPLAIGRDQNPERCLRRSLNGRTPRVGHLGQ
jgi:hypothetical protein